MRTIRRRFPLALILVVAASTAPPVFAASVERGPYLQRATSSSITIRWRTDTTTDAIVRYGVTLGALNSTAVGNQSDTEHEVTVSGLAAGTLYYYSVGDSSGALAGGDSSYRFRTSPANASGDTRVWVVGDSGTANNNARAVRDAYLAYSGTEPADLWLMLGDNAYDDGTDLEYQAAVFDMYPTILRNTPLWPTLGNHDGHSADSSSEQGPYYEIFSLPRNGEAGGLASGTEAYYSFDYGNIHFVTLDSYETDRSTNGAMLTWLENDLAATNKEWLIAFWHHPPYSKGSHNSDSSSEVQMRDMRERALPILESYGVDLVLTGHSHSYERSTLIDGHYGLSNSFDPASMELNGGSGREDDTGAYDKPVIGNPNQGTVYAVAGSSGKTSSGPLNHPVMFVSLQTLGSMILDVDGSRMDAAFIDGNGTRRDYFTIQKGTATGDSESPTPPANLAVSNLAQTSLTLSWQASTDNVGVTGYRVARDGNVLATTTSLGFDDSGLTAGTQYTYSVLALDAAGNESAAASISVTTSAAPDVDPPTPPADLAVSAFTSTSVTLTWDAATDNVGVVEYRVARDGIMIASVNSLSYVDINLTPGTSYSYSVFALDAAGNVSAQATIMGSTSTAPDIDPPTAPGGLTASAITSSSVTLTWNAATDNVAVTEYRVSRDGVVVSSDNALSFVDNGLTASSTYSYNVVALDAAGNKSAQATISVTTASAPDIDAPSSVVNLAASAITSSSVTLTWDAATDNVAVTEYRVSRDGVVVSSDNALSFVDNGLTASSTYSYNVVALDAAGNESTPAVVSVTTAADATPTIRQGGGGSLGLLDLLALAVILAMTRRQHGLLRVFPGVCLILILWAPQPAKAHADVDERLAAVNAQLAGRSEAPYLLAKRGNLHGEHGDWQLAIADLRQAQALAPDELAAALDLDIALALLRNRDAMQALPFVDRYLVTHPRSSAAWRLRGQIQLGLADTDAALKDFNNAIQYANVLTPEHYFERARALEKEPDRYDELLMGIDDGVEKLGPLASLLQYAIDVEIRRGNNAGALARIAALPAAMRQQPRWLYRRSQVLEKLGRSAEAENMNRQALQAISELPAQRRNAAAFGALRRDIESSYAALINQGKVSDDSTD